MFAASRSNFSAPDGFGVNTRRGPRASAASMRPGSQKPREISEQTSQAGIRAVDASLGGQNIRIARRMIVTTTLKRSLALDVAITSFDVCLHANMLATCMGKMVYLWALDTLTVLQKFGRTTGSVHRENIRDCKFNLAGTLLATCGEDKRIVIWNLKTNRSQKVIEGHKGVIYQIEFSEDDSRIYSASDDGTIQIWEWKTGTLLASYIRHPSAIRCFDFNYDHPDRIVCGRSDGCVATWDTMRELMIDEIKPDPDWVQDGVERNLMAWADPERNHTGAITCIRISPSNHLLATGATDNTCKIWNIVSYTKDYNLVQQEERESDRVRDMLDQPIRADEERYNAQIDQRDFRGLKAGEVPLQMGFHADLLHTFRHEGPVMAVRFNNSSSIAITGCIDSTCRLWSIRRGDLLFQINVPAPVTSIFVDAADDMYCACQNRLLFFGIKANIKEEDLPNYWQRRSIKDLTSQLEETPTGGLESHVSPEAAALITQINDEKLAGGIQKMITIPELRNLISHGLVLPTVLDTMLESYPEVNTDKLAENMLKSDITARDVLRLFVNSPFHPRDILAAISAAKDGDGLWAAIKAGAPISQYMLKMGFKNLDELAPGDQKSIFLDFKDFFPRGRNLLPGARRARARLPGAPGPDTEYDFYDWSSEDEESYLLEEEMRADYYAARSLPRGKILHFIPSEQIKLLKDYHANRDLKPIFLRDLVLDLNTVSGYPNFNVDAETRDTRPLMAQKAIQRQGVRFNEMSTLQRAGRNKYARRRGDGRPFNIHSLPLNLGASYEKVRATLASSTQPDQQAKYKRARGLNIRFGQPGQMGNVQRGHVYSEPIVIRQNRQEVRHQFVVGKGISVPEQSGGGE